MADDASPERLGTFHVATCLLACACVRLELFGLPAVGGAVPVARCAVERHLPNADPLFLFGGHAKVKESPSSPAVPFAAALAQPLA